MSGIKPTNGTVRAEWDGSRVKLRPSSFLGDILFRIYRRAASPAIYSKEFKCQIASIDQFLQVEEGLQLSGFRVVRTSELEEALGALDEERRLEREAMDERLARIEADLQTRGYSLYPYQREGALFLAMRSNAFLADDMGLGKTVQILAALPEGARALVVCPASVRSVWLDETKRFRPDLSVRTVEERGQSLVPGESELVAVSYDLLSASNVDLSGCILIADEAHALKGQKSIRSQRFRHMGQTAARIWIATATPIANRPQEIYSVLQAGRMHLEAFDSYETFLMLYGVKKGRFGLMWPTANDEEEAKQKISPEVPERLARVMLRRTKEEVLPQLPPRTFRTIRVDVAKELERACDDALIELGDDLGEDLLDPELEESLPFKRISELRKKLAIAKFPVLVDLVDQYEEQAEPLVVFSAHRFGVDKLGKREGWRKITGDEKDVERAESVRLFQEGKLKGIALTIKAGGTGLTLTRAAHMVFLDESFVPADNDQARDRIYRLGQKRGVLVTRIAAEHPLDWRLDVLLAQKRAVIAATLKRRKGERDAMAALLANAALEAQAKDRSVALKWEAA